MTSIITSLTQEDVHIIHRGPCLIYIYVDIHIYIYRYAGARAECRLGPPCAPHLVERERERYIYIYVYIDIDSQ